MDFNKQTIYSPTVEPYDIFVIKVSFINHTEPEMYILVKLNYHRHSVYKCTETHSRSIVISSIGTDWAM